MRAASPESHFATSLIDRLGHRLSPGCPDEGRAYFLDSAGGSDRDSAGQTQLREKSVHFIVHRTAHINDGPALCGRQITYHGRFKSSELRFTSLLFRSYDRMSDRPRISRVVCQMWRRHCGNRQPVNIKGRNALCSDILAFDGAVTPNFLFFSMSHFHWFRLELIQN
jgi:hypothetical protein